MNKQPSFFRQSFPIIFMVTIVPLIIMGGLFFYFLSTFNPNEMAAEEIKTEAEELIADAEKVERFVQMPTGEVAVFTGSSSNLVLREWQPETDDIHNTYPIDSDVFNQLFVIYQPNGIIFATTSSEDLLQLYSYQFGTEPTKMEHSPIFIDSFLDQSTLAFNNQLYFIGKNETDDFIASTVQNDQVETINFSQMAQLQNIIESDFNNFSYTDIDYPIVELTTYNRDEYFFDLHHQTNQSLLHFEDEPQLEIETQLLAPYHEMEAPLLTIENGPIAQNIFYPELYYLTKDLILIFGADGVREDATTSGYVLNATGEDIVKSVPQTDIWTGYEEGSFQAQFLEETNTIYLSSTLQAGKIPLNNDAIQFWGLTDYQVALDKEATTKIEQANQLLEEGAQFSFAKVDSFVQNDIRGTVLATNFLIFLSIPLLVFGVRRIFKQLINRQIERAYTNGGRKLTGTITDIAQTGIHVNEQPQVKMNIHFVYNGRTKNNNLKIIANLIQPPQVGDQIEIIYDPIKDKIFAAPEEEGGW